VKKMPTKGRRTAWRLMMAGMLCAAAFPGESAPVRSAAEPDYPPLSIVNAEGAADGFSVELLREVLLEMGRAVTFEVGTWPVIRQQLADGELDVLPLVGRTPEREALYDFTIPYLTLHGALFIRDDNTDIRSWEDVKDKRVAVMKGDNAEEYVRRVGLSDHILAPDSYEEAFRMLSDGRADAVIAQKLMGVTLLRDMGLTNVRVVGKPSEEFTQTFCFAVTKGNEALRAILDEGLAIVIAKGVNRRLERKWLGFSEREAALARVILYGGDHDFPPYEFLDERGRPAGFNIDLARAVAVEIGVDISFHLAPWDEIRRKLDNGELDVAGMFYLASRARSVEFTVPHTRVHHAVFVRADGPAYTGLDDLEGRRIAVQNRDVMHDFLLEQGVESMTLTLTGNPEEAMALLARGQVDYALIAHLQGIHLISQKGWGHLHADETRLHETEYCYALQKGNTALRDLFNDGLRSLEASGEYREIYNRWLGVLEPDYPWRRFARIMVPVLFSAALLAALAVGAIAVLRTQVRKRTVDLVQTNRALEESRAAAVKLMDEAVQARGKLQRTQFAVDHTADAVFWLDPAGRLIYVNEAACRSLGYTQEELLRMAVMDVDPDFHKERWAGHWQELKTRQRMTFETSHRAKDGRVFPVEVHANYMAVDGNEYNFALAHDITARKRAEAEKEQMLAAARQSRQVLLSVLDDERRTAAERTRLAAAIEQSAETIMITDAEGIIIYTNPAFEKTTGYTREEALGQNPRILQSGKQDTPFYQQMWAMLTEGKVWRGRMVNKRKAGTLYEEDATISPVRDAAGAVVNYVAVKRDITHEVKLENQLRQAQKMEAVGILAGGVAHDFNNQLMGIMGFTDLCRDQIEVGHPIRDWLDEIMASAQRSAEITRQLMAFARKQPIAPKVLDLNDAVARMLKLLRRLIGEGIDLSWQPCANLHPVKMDPSQIDQIVTNLCVNARDALAGIRPGELTLKTENIVLDDTFCVRHPEALPGAYVSLSVRDNGCGMDEETLARVFEPFFTTKGLGKGTGLGMATVYGIVKQNNGFVYAISEVGKGSTFTVYLPAVAEPPETVVAGKGEVPRGRGETILLVEDEESLRRPCEMFLEKSGYQVLSAASPEEARQLAEEHPGEIRLLLTDVVMPGMDGVQLAKLLSAEMPALKVVFMSGYTADVIVEHGVVDEDVQFLSKPFSRDTLACKMREVLDAD